MKMPLSKKLPSSTYEMPSSIEDNGNFLTYAFGVGESLITPYLPKRL